MQRIQMRRVQNWNRVQISIGQNLSILLTLTEFLSLQIRYQCAMYNAINAQWHCCFQY